MKKWPFFAIILPWMASYGSERSFLLIFIARDDLVKVSCKSDARKCQNQGTLLTLTSWVKEASPFERKVRIAHLKEWWHWWRWCWNFLGIKTVLGFLFGFPPKSKHAHLYFIFLIFAKLITFHAKGLITILRFTQKFSCCWNSNNVDRLKSNLVSKSCEELRIF